MENGSIGSSDSLDSLDDRASLSIINLFFGHTKILLQQYSEAEVEEGTHTAQLYTYSSLGKHCPSPSWIERKASWAIFGTKIRPFC